MMVMKWKKAVSGDVCGRPPASISLWTISSLSNGASRVGGNMYPALCIRPHGHRKRHFQRFQESGPIVGAEHAVDPEVGHHRIDGDLARGIVVHVLDGACQPLVEMGRASCRERVCQYV